MAAAGFLSHYLSGPLPYVAISRSSQCPTTGATKAVVCVILSGMMHIKEPLLLIGQSRLCGGSGFPLTI